MYKLFPEKDAINKLTTHNEAKKFKFIIESSHVSWNDLILRFHKPYQSKYHNHFDLTKISIEERNIESENIIDCQR